MPDASQSGSRARKDPHQSPQNVPPPSPPQFLANQSFWINQQIQSLATNMNISTSRITFISARQGSTIFNCQIADVAPKDRSPGEPSAAQAAQTLNTAIKDGSFQDVSGHWRMARTFMRCQGLHAQDPGGHVVRHTKPLLYDTDRDPHVRFLNRPWSARLPQNPQMPLLSITFVTNGNSQVSVPSDQTVQTARGDKRISKYNYVALALGGLALLVLAIFSKRILKFLCRRRSAKSEAGPWPIVGRPRSRTKTRVYPDDIETAKDEDIKALAEPRKEQKVLVAPADAAQGVKGGADAVAGPEARAVVVANPPRPPQQQQQRAGGNVYAMGPMLL